MSFAYTPGENLVELRDKKGLKASVLVNLHHPQTMKALAEMFMTKSWEARVLTKA